MYRIIIFMLFGLIFLDNVFSNDTDFLIEKLRRIHAEEKFEEVIIFHNNESNDHIKKTNLIDLSFEKIDELIKFSWENNKFITSLAHKRQSYIYLSETAGALDDPLLSYGKFIDPVETRVGPQDFRIGISQKYPWSKKRSLKRAVAGKNVDMADYQIVLKKMEIRKQLKHALLDMYLTGKQVSVKNDMLKIIQYLENVLIVKYKTGMGEHSYLVKLQLEKEKLLDRIIRLEQMKTPLSEKIKAVSGLTIEQDIEWPLTLLEPFTFESLEYYSDLILKNNPKIHIESIKIEQQKKKKLLERQMKYPDITIGLEYVNTDSARMPNVTDSGKDPLIAKIAINLPINRKKYKNKENAVSEGVESIQNNLIQLKKQFNAKLNMEYFNLQENYRRFYLYKDQLIPRAQECYEITLQGYSADKIIFTELMDTVKTLLELKLSLEIVRVEFWKNYAEIEEICGFIKEEK